MRAAFLSIAVGFAIIPFLIVQAEAHASGRGFVLLLPTATMQVSGAIAVAASFVLIALVPPGFLRSIFREWHLGRVQCPRIETAISIVSGAVLVALIVVGFIGARDPFANPLPLAVWTFVWMALPNVCAVFGNVWAIINPWSGLARILGPREPLFSLPAGLGYAPAITGLLAFGWLEIVDLAPDDPARLATAVALYSLITVTGMVLFGERIWTERCEFLSVFFRFIALLAPIRTHRSGRHISLRIGLPGAGLVSAPAPSISGAVFILCALATVSFDGLSETWWWLIQLGINVLEFPGRSAVVSSNTIGLLASCALLTGLFALSLMLGRAMSRGMQPMRKALPRLALSILPISVAYHFAHYLTALLVNAQYGLATATDPLATGADWLNLGQFYVTTSFLNVAESVALIWQTQSGAIIIGHIIAVCVAHRIALDFGGTPNEAARAQLPLAALMVLYTVFGLWLLASPTA